MTTSFTNIFKNIRETYNLLDFAQKPRGKSLPKSRLAFKKEYEIFSKYKQGEFQKIEAINKITSLNNLNEKQARDIIDNIKEKNIIPMRLKQNIELKLK